MSSSVDPATAGAARVARIIVDEGGSTSLHEVLPRLTACEQDAICRVVLISISPAAVRETRLAEAINRRLRASRRVVIAVLDGEYEAAGVTVAAGADLVVASDRTTFSLDTTTVGFHETWFADLPLRSLKWLSLCAGPLSASQLFNDGFINFVSPASELAATGTKVAEDVARVPADVLTVKKLAHGTRHRFSESNGVAGAAGTTGSPEGIQP